MSSKMVEMEDEGTRRFLSYSKKIIADIEEHRTSEAGNQFANELNTFLRLISDRIHGSEEARAIRTKHTSKENELCKQEIATLMRKMENHTIAYNDDVRKHEDEKKYYEEKAKKAFRESEITSTERRMKNEHDMIIYQESSEKRLNKLEQIIAEKQKKLRVSKEANDVKIEHLKRELLKKEMLLKTTGERYKNDISERLQKKKSLQQSNELKRKLIETLNEEKISVEMSLRERDEKLKAIREKMAFRTIVKFLQPNVNIKLAHYRQKEIQKKNKNKRKAKNKIP